MKNKRSILMLAILSFGIFAPSKSATTFTPMKPKDNFVCPFESYEEAKKVCANQAEKDIIAVRLKSPDPKQKPITQLQDIGICVYKTRAEAQKACGAAMEEQVKKA